jgi:hypothetical protein
MSCICSTKWYRTGRPDARKYGTQNSNRALIHHTFPKRQCMVQVSVDTARKRAASASPVRLRAHICTDSIAALRRWLGVRAGIDGRVPSRCLPLVSVPFRMGNGAIVLSGRWGSREAPPVKSCTLCRDGAHMPMSGGCAWGALSTISPSTFL